MKPNPVKNVVRDRIDEKAKELEKFVPHFIVDEDCFFSCSLYCCDDNRKSDKCDCGRDQRLLELAKACLIAEVKAKLELLDKFQVTYDFWQKNIMIKHRNELTAELAELENYK